MNETVQLVLYEIAGVRYASDLTQVRRIGALDREQTVVHPLGEPNVGKRALVFAVNDHTEAQLAVDVVLGVHAVKVDDLRRLPSAASSSPVTIGAWVNGNQTILLVDLHATTPTPSRGTV